MTSSAAAQYTKEGATLKNKAKKLIEAFVQEQTKRKAAGLKVHGDEPRMALRAMRSILLTPDSFYGDLLEQALSENWSGEILKNKVRAMMEAGAHRRFSPAPHFMGHHTGGSLASLGPSAQVAKPNVLRQALIEVTERGAKLGESGLTWLPEYAHTGAINRRLKKLGLSNLDTPGISYLNAHLGSNKFTGYNVDPIAGVGSSDDLVKAWWDSGTIPQQLLDAQIGIEAATSELDELAKVAKEFNLDINKNPAEVQKLLRKNPNLLERVVKAGKTPTIENVPSFEARASLGNLPEAVTKANLFKDYTSNIIKKSGAVVKPFKPVVKKGAKYVLPAAGLVLSNMNRSAISAEYEENPTNINLARKKISEAQVGLETADTATLGATGLVTWIPNLMGDAAEYILKKVQTPQTKEESDKEIQDQLGDKFYTF